MSAELAPIQNAALREEITKADAEIEALRAEVERLRADLMESDEIREKLGHLLTRTAAALKGEPPAGVWHSWHDLPEKATQLAEALRKLEERERGDEALLRQALEVLLEDRNALYESHSVPGQIGIHVDDDAVPALLRYDDLIKLIRNRLGDPA